ncbi:hypothetical protein [Streptomyces sp. NBC_00467]|uniref:hypothetical protein n=1 Tax=Streptomyces sp. NBC_00467 TaxID=2975752 RepID=UPI002E183EDF
MDGLVGEFGAGTQGVARGEVGEPDRRQSKPGEVTDRQRVVRVVVQGAYGVDLAVLWPRLWLILPEPAVQQIRAGRDSFSAAARLASWAVGYGLLASWWWPAVLIAVGCWAVARSRARPALDAFASLIEAAVDVHGRELARASA